MSNQRAEQRVSLMTGSAALPLGAAVWPCYNEVFGDFADSATWCSDLFERHAARDGFRLAASIEDDQVIGFAWGYIGQLGQYWSDLVHDALPPEIVSQWVGGHFEIVELAVLPAHRRNGLGQALHDRLLDGVKRRCLLSTSDDADDPPVQLYTRSGWRKLGMLRPGVQVMGHNRA